MIALQEFQSLIGRLKTESWDGRRRRKKRFQSLIGRLKTVTPDQISLIERLFQSLIGRLKTGGPRIPTTRRKEVSIPHR